jgi:uncharacterized protein YwqG
MMSEDEMRALIAATARAAVFFEPIFPPRHGNPTTSYFGGRPRLPAQISWPVANIKVGWEVKIEAGRRALAPITAPVASTFLGQIDLGELPIDVNFSPMPKQGTLYFFSIPRPLNSSCRKSPQQVER